MKTLYTLVHSQPDSVWAGGTKFYVAKFTSLQDQSNYRTDGKTYYRKLPRLHYNYAKTIFIIGKG